MVVFMMFLKMYYKVLESKKLTWQAKLIISHLLSLQSSGRQFWGFMNWFERWGISQAQAEQVFNVMNEKGLIWQDSAMNWHIAEYTIIEEYLEN